MKSNTITRAHVVGPAQTPASADRVTENCRTSSDEKSTEQTIEPADLPSRKERRKQRQQEIENELPGSPSPRDTAETQAPAQADDSEGDESTGETAQLSRKKQKKLRKLQEKLEKQRESDSKTTIAPDENTKPKSTPPNNPRKAQRKANAASTPPTSISPSSDAGMAAKYYPLLVCSLGNPGAQYANTLHSAGHRILEGIRDVGVYHPFIRSMGGKVATPNNSRMSFGLTGFKKDGERASIDGEDNWTLWQSTKLMNISGPAVNTAWREFSQKQRNLAMEGRLVVLHDELEAELGKVSIRRGTASPKGHNGLKSVQASLGKNEWWRIGVGIGRPISRDAADVSKYVLGKMTYGQEKAMDDAVIVVMHALRKIAEGKV